MKHRKESVEIEGQEGKRDPDRLTIKRITFIGGQVCDRLYAKPFTCYLIEVLQQTFSNFLKSIFF